MKKYLILAEVCFDWSGGEYSDAYIPDIFLGIEEFENEVYAMSKAKLLLETYCNTVNSDREVRARDYYSEITLKEIQ